MINSNYNRDLYSLIEKLISAFKPWYFKHNNENDENMCYIKIELTNGFFIKIVQAIEWILKLETQSNFHSDLIYLQLTNFFSIIMVHNNRNYNMI